MQVDTCTKERMLKGAPLFCVVLALIGLSTASHAELRKKVCNSDSDCVKVLSSTGQMMIDELDFAKDTVGTVLERLPSWFGPARPVSLMFKDKVVPLDKKLGQLGMAIGGSLRIIPTPKEDL